MQTVLVVDPGKATGIAVLEDGNIIRSDTINFEDYRKWERVFSLQYDGIVCEDYKVWVGAESKNYNTKIWALEVIGFLRYMKHSNNIPNWKMLAPVVKKNQVIPKGIANSEHARDALRLAKYWHDMCKGTKSEWDVI